jgi:hypothetical protein
MGKRSLAEMNGREEVQSGTSSYSPVNDLTLTRSQASDRRFHTKDRSFRSASNSTLKGYSSGYHESAVTTDTFNLMRDAKNNRNGTHMLRNQGRRSFYQNEKTVNSQSLKMVMDVADGFRTDTAQTILSASNGKVAGHSGSGIKTTGQADAHNLLRKKTLDILKLDPNKTQGISTRSVETLFASITVSSMAPGELARNVDGGSRTLKSKSVSNWEVNRNESKARVQTLFDQLNSNEQSFVMEHASDFMDSTQDRNNSKRRISKVRPTSPMRNSRGGDLSEIQGGEYLTHDIAHSPRVKPSVITGENGMFVTEPFRAERRSIWRLKKRLKK